MTHELDVEAEWRCGGNVAACGGAEQATRDFQNPCHIHKGNSRPKCTGVAGNAMQVFAARQWLVKREICDPEV